MNLRTNNPLNSERAVHYKLYKSGKLWLVAGVTFCSFVGNAIINDQIAHADTVTVAKTATTVTRTTVSADSKTSNDSTQADTVSTTANKVAKTTSNIAHQPNSATNSLNTSQAATATSSTTTKAASSILSQADSETANSNTSQAVTATSSATTEAVSSAANQTGQKVSSSNNKSHEAKAHTTSAASGSISQVSNTAVKSAASTENTNKATSVASSAVNRQATTTKKADINLTTVTAATANTKPATQVRLMATSSAAMKIKPITYKIQSKQMTRNQYQWQGNNLYYYGNDGQPITGLRHYSNNKLEYYGTDHVQYRNRYASQGNQLYYFGSNGDAVTGLRHYGNNKLEYYGTDHVQYRNRYASQGNQLYYFGSNGDAVTGLRHYDNNKLEYYGADHVQYRNRYYQEGNKFYYFGGNGDAITGLRHYGNNKLEYYGTDHVQYRNRYASQGNQLYYFGSNGDAMVTIRGAIENGKFNIYDMRTNKLIKSLDAGTWENLAYSMDANSINNVDGYLSYSGWYRPIGTSQDGKTWYKTGAGDWRPILMYAWPNKDVQAQFIKYFVNHGYENANYGLTKVSVANLNKDTDATVLNTAAQNLRYVIEQSIATNKGTGKLANDINGFAATVPELSASSELSLQSMPNYKPDKSGTVDNDQVIFVNDADSKYRLMNRTINNQTGNDNSDNSPELLVGNDIDNSNPVVQAENLNWEYFLLNYGKLMGYNQDGNFDGFRIDAADNIDADVLDQMGQLMNDMYHMKGNPQNANNHLSYNEGYHSGAAQMLNKKGNPQLYMDSREFYTLENVLGRANNRDTISHLVTNSIVNRQNDVTENEATPNWSFVTNHDQRKNLINRLIIRDHPGIAYKAEYANQAWQEFYADQKKTDKQYAQYNVPAQYAILLNKDTVPQIYYGDLYNETAQYMQEKSIYYDAITTLMKARKQFVSGGQTMTKLSDNLIASVRYGKGVANANSEGTDSLSRTSGMAVIVGNNPQMAEQTISINMGRAHANEQYRNLLDTTDNGLTYNADGAENPETLTTDDNGILKVTVKGYSNPYVSGYLGVWVPVVSGNQDVTTNAATVSADSNKIFESNAALDSHMIYEDFSLYQPEPTSTENHAYNIIAQNAELFNNLGITDFWMAPAYTPFGMSRYNEGYSMTDRYNLGTNANPTKYGSGEELANAIATLHSAGLKVQEDIVMNQMIGFSGQEAVTVTRTNDRGMQIYVNGKTYANQIYFAYTTGGGNGQETYGGKYLSELQSKYPDLFTTRAISTGVAPDPTTHITKWSAKYENGTSLQNIGIGLAVKLPNGDYAYLDGGNNDKFKTTLPEQMGSIGYYV
ncbi:glycoside hydrolase family 70 protein [Loigolactobacillus backii]|uniref:glycoside hydrolase family 70 protein n=1 Tax=Loigolactobacillus backii TaxID=375175 RepID=UPI000A72BAA7|nr:glycoside hydrolase family 70 protein [Loigolactobacillus backii]